MLGRLCTNQARQWEVAQAGVSSWSQLHSWCVTLGKLVAFSLCVCSLRIAMRPSGTMIALLIEQPVRFISLNPYHLKWATGRTDLFGFMVAGDAGEDLATVSLFTTA